MQYVSQRLADPGNELKIKHTIGHMPDGYILMQASFHLLVSKTVIDGHFPLERAPTFLPMQNRIIPLMPTIMIPRAPAWTSLSAVSMFTLMALSNHTIYLDSRHRR